ncbi:predicted protein [Chaetomium globosum CBS 148.51]|uniref:Uncharacterized protein n=1 Tax=Chaetomium globosum (strain ATCC 6205 / CBS 148.51 / DSM 1962 / NBRC 6347 / NRRL 1970) TaxID=306901 RepID=Q2GXJ6_CHAGB|nr:uncharacterized protein CHGG_07308 [Chaetomium globosum CBS 148.51]EAQ86055.1 predicted protein [Chaetomium globosum CBS 148.51]
MPESPPSSRRASARSNGTDHDRVGALTPTLQIARSTSPLPIIPTDLARLKIANRDARHIPPPAPWHLGPFYEEAALRNPMDRPYSRNNTGDSTVLSHEHSIVSSREDSDTSSDDDGYYSPSTADWRRPPPQPLPPRGNPRFVPPPPWYRHPPAGPIDRQPPIQHFRGPNPDYSDPESEDGRRNELQELLNAQQRRIRQLRSQIAGKRKELRGLRRRKDDTDNSLMQFFRPHLVSTKNGVAAVIPIDVLEAKIGEMQKIRDEYYTAEIACEAMEIELEMEERKLEELEDRPSRSPFRRADVVPKIELSLPPPTMRGPDTAEVQEQDDSSDEDDSAPPTPVSLLGISGQLHEDVHPLYEELLEAAGDRQLAKEDVEDLGMRREKILYDLEIELHRKRVRENQGNQISEEDLLSLRSSLAQVPTDAAEFEHLFGITISEDELEFLRNYDSAFQRARTELESATETLSDLRALCLKKGVMRKHASYHEELAIHSSSPDWLPSPQDGNMAIEPPSRPSPNRNHPHAPPPSLAHPRFPILLSNPSHVLSLLTPLQALKRTLKLPKDDPRSALRRAECMKELGISTLMTKAENKPDYINQWLIHRLRTSPIEAELMLAVCEGVFKVVNLRRWQEEVLYYWRLDEAANMGAELFDGPVSHPDPGGVFALGPKPATGAGVGVGAGAAPGGPVGGGVPPSPFPLLPLRGGGEGGGGFGGSDGRGVNSAIGEGQTVRSDAGRRIRNPGARAERSMSV